MSPLHLALIFGVSVVGFALATDSGWQEGRGTWFDVQNGDLTTANCHLRWDQIRTGKNVGAFSDTHSMFRGSCGMCVEIRCQNAVFKDGYGQNLDRSKACKDPNRSVYITIADACPCNYPNNQHS
ncbi:expansin-A24, partial [Haematococcus lacustris]